MEFKLEEAQILLGRTPNTLKALLYDLPPAWLEHNEGENTWSPIQVVAHLIEAEQTNWLPRAKAILEGRAFPVFDRFAHLQQEAKEIGQLLEEFALLRQKNLQDMEAMHLSPIDLQRTGQHPEFGTVKLEQLLATWVAHDLGHLVQITRTLAKNYREAVGPWRAYLSALR